MTNYGSEYIFALVFLLSSVVLVSFFQKHKISSVLAYLSIGVLLGPHVLGLNEYGDGEGTHILGEVGILFLMFTIGLDLPWERLKVLRSYIFSIGLGQVLVTGLCFASIAFLAGIQLKASIVLGGALALSSTAVVLQELSDRRELASRHGRVAFAVLLLQDLAVVALLMFANLTAASSQSVLLLIGQTVLKIGLVLGVMVFFARFVLSPLYRTIAQLKSTELLMATTLLVVFGISFITQLGGLSKELGAFIAGLMLASTEYRHQVEADIFPFRGLLLGLFFVTMGLSIDLSLLAQDPLGVMGLLSAILVIKGVIVFVLGWIFQMALRTRIRFTFLLASGGEFLFVLLSPHLAFGLIDELLRPYIILCTALSMALTPLLNQLGSFVAHLLCQEDEILPSESGALKNHVIIAGFGRLGKIVADLLKHNRVSFVILDLNVQKVSEGRKLGLPIFVGDIKRTDIISAVGGDRAKVILIAIEKQSFATKVAIAAQRMFPDAQVIVGVTEENYAEKLIQAGVKVLMHDSLERNLSIAQHVLSGAGVPSDHIRHALDHVRKTRSLVIPPLGAK